MRPTNLVYKSLLIRDIIKTVTKSICSRADALIGHGHYENTSFIQGIYKGTGMIDITQSGLVWQSF